MKNARDLFGKTRDQFADIRGARYVRPRGIGLHVFKPFGSGVEIIGGAIAGNITFAPGDLVEIGSHSGRRNPTILGFPPAGSRGGGAVQLAEYTDDSTRPIIIQAHPVEVPAGSVDFRVILVGRLLNSAPVDYFEAILWDEATAAVIPDPLVTVHDPEHIPDPTVEGLDLEPGEDAVAVLVDVDAARAVGSTISYRAGR